MTRSARISSGRCAAAAETSGSSPIFEYRLHPVGPVVTHAAAMYPVEAAAAVLPGFRDYVETAPDAVNASATFWTVPSMPSVSRTAPRAQRDRRQRHLCRRRPRGQQVLHALRTFGDPLLDVSESRAYTSVQQMFDVFFPKHALRYYWKELSLDSLCDSAISRLADGVLAQSVAAFHARRLGAGRRARSRRDQAIQRSESRNSPFLLEILANWKEPEESDANLAWARGVFDEMRQCTGEQTELQFPGCRGRPEVVRERGSRRAVRAARRSETKVRPRERVPGQSEHYMN